MNHYEIYWAGYKSPELMKQAWCVRFPDGSVRQFAGFSIEYRHVNSVSQLNRSPNGYLVVDEGAGGYEINEETNEIRFLE